MAICLLAGVAAGPGAWPADENAPVGIAARVNGVIIRTKAVERAEFLITGLQGGEEPDPFTKHDRQRFRRLALDRLIAEELFYQESVARGITIDKKEANAFLKGLKGILPKREEIRLLIAHWAVKGNIMKAVERHLLIRRLLEQEVLNKAQVSGESVEQFYRGNQSMFRSGPEVRLEQILIVARTGEPIESVRAKAQEVAERARAGADFAALARDNSQGPGRNQGGDFGWRSVNHLRTNLRAAVQEASEGTVIGPILTPGGFVIAKLKAKRSSRVLPLEEVQDHLLKYLRRGEVKRRYESFLEGLRAQATIKVYMPPLDLPSAQNVAPR